MSSEEFIISSLKRIYDECEKAQDRAGDELQAVLLLPGIAEKYNQTLELVKESHEDNPIIQALEDIQPREPVARARTYSTNYERIQRIKINVTTIADYMGIDMNDFQSPPPDGLPHINIVQRQNVSQSVDIQTILSQVEQTPMKGDEREELRELIEEFQELVDATDPDKTRLKTLYEKIAGYSEAVALQVGIYALKQGVDLVLPT